MSLMARLGSRGNRKVPFALFDGSEPIDLTKIGDTLTFMGTVENLPSNAGSTYFNVGELPDLEISNDSIGNSIALSADAGGVVLSDAGVYVIDVHMSGDLGIGLSAFGVSLGDDKLTDFSPGNVIAANVDTATVTLSVTRKFPLDDIIYFYAYTDTASNLDPPLNGYIKCAITRIA